MSKKLTLEYFIYKANIRHNGQWDYSKSIYVDCKTKIEIGCEKHGYFWQNPMTHIQSHGCPNCVKEKRLQNPITDIETILHQFKELYCDTYKYYPDTYVNKNKNMKMSCERHGYFYKTPYSHFNKKQGCPKCSKELLQLKQNDIDYNFIDRASLVHDCYYIYDKTIYRRNNLKVIITCPNHGDFLQTPNNHLNGAGCPECKRNTLSVFKTNDFELMQNDFNNLHNFKYDYSQSLYVNNITPIKIGCPTHGFFWQKPIIHQQGCGCSKCNIENKISKPEIEVQDFVKSLGYEIETNNRKILKGKELDIYIPELKKAVEFNGSYWHYHPTHFVPGKHGNKSNLCREKGIKLLHIREDLWISNKEKVKDFIIAFIKNKGDL